MLTTGYDIMGYIRHIWFGFVGSYAEHDNIRPQALIVSKK